MRYPMILCGMFALFVMSFASPSTAGIFGKSIEERAAAVHEQTEGLHNYHAYLARELASIAEDENAQHDRADCEFMKLAEEAAARAGRE